MVNEAYLNRVNGMSPPYCCAKSVRIVRARCERRFITTRLSFGTVQPMMKRDRSTGLHPRRVRVKQDPAAASAMPYGIPALASCNFNTHAGIA